jgi:hypothetical protein
MKSGKVDDMGRSELREAFDRGIIPDPMLLAFEWIEIVCLGEEGIMMRAYLDLNTGELFEMMRNKSGLNNRHNNIPINTGLNFSEVFQAS